MLQVGSVNIPNSKNKVAEYRIRNMKTIYTVILPIFDKYTLLTSKKFQYEIFKKALLIYMNSTLSNENKNQELLHLHSLTLPEYYRSIAWSGITNLTLEKAQTILSKEWLIGFIEAEGSFYLVKKGANRIVHTFEITRKKDKIVLEAIAIILSMKIYNKNTYFTCVTSNRKDVGLIIDYFNNTMKGMKSLEFRI